MLSVTDEKKADPGPDTTASTTPDTTPAPPPDEARPAPTIWGAPLASFVRGGTSTMGNDRDIAEREADAEKRRDVSDAEKRIAQVPVEHGGGRIYANRLTENHQIPKAYIVLDFVSSRGEPVYKDGVPLQCLADLVTIGPNELALILVCPKCIQNKRPQGDAQIQIRQSNKHWTLDTRKGGELVRFEDGLYPTAGRIEECEPFTCDRCGWCARITDNRVRSI